MDTNSDSMQPFTTALLDSFENFEDIRNSRRTMYPLKDVLFLVFTSSLRRMRTGVTQV